MISITRPDHVRYKQWMKAQTAHGRHKSGLYLIESRKLVAEALAAGVELQNVILREDAWETWEETKSLAAARGRLQNWEEDLPFVSLAANLFDRLASSQTPDGILAVATLPARDPVPRRLKGRVLILDHLQDPGNVGTLLRSAEAFGFKSVLGFESADFYAPKTLRSAMGSTFRLDLYAAHQASVDAWHEAMGLFWWGADLKGFDVRRVTWPEEFALVIGNEGRGLSPAVIARLHETVTIPMQKVESLNAAVSGSLLMGLAALERHSGNR
ncbi:MAG: RNA methyltransferase [Peptoniphilaceae bacterium]|nr:RNA methyltransferase [Peptoniphilaceae bacterium]MDY6085942.1 RNA methyltransferase [Peptoniphilaceae bacterium]